MSNVITAVLQALGLKAKDLSLDGQTAIVEQISGEAGRLFDLAANGFDQAAAIKLDLSAQYDRLAARLQAESDDAFDAASELEDSAAKDQQRADKIRDLLA